MRISLLTSRDWSQRQWISLASVGAAMLAGFLWVDRSLLAIIVAAVALAILIGECAAWFVWGRDHIDIDDDSVLAAGPPDRLRPCLAAVLYDGGAHDRTVGVGLLELAEHGLIEIHDDPVGGHGTYVPRAWITAKTATARQRAELGGPERLLAGALAAETHGHAKLDPITVVTAIGFARPAYEVALDDELMDEGWYRQPPFRTFRLWLDGAEVVIAAGVLGVVLAFLAISLPLVIAFASVICVGWVGSQVAAEMPARTRAGAMVTAMLKAYRRSLGKTLAMSNSVWDVLRADDFAWFETPDRMIVWAMALDLESDLTAMFARMERSSPRDAWFPAWFGTTVPDPQRMFRSLERFTSSPAS